MHRRLHYRLSSMRVVTAAADHSAGGLSWWQPLHPSTSFRCSLW